MLGILRSGLYEAVGRAPSPRQVADAALTTTIVKIHHGSRATYGAPRVPAELRFGLGIACGRKRVARLMRAAGLVGFVTGANAADAGRCWHRMRTWSSAGSPPRGPDRLWCTDITEHPTSTGKVYCAAVLDVFTRKVVGRSIADHMCSEFVVDAL